MTQVIEESKGELISPSTFYAAVVSTIPTAVAWSASCTMLTGKDGVMEECWSCAAYDGPLGKGGHLIARGSGNSAGAALDNLQMVEPMPSKVGKAC